ncbi:MAG: hypothetical protein ABI729_00215 [Chitinophagales bacterium]
MNFIPGNVYHIYNRGNQQQQIFYSRENYIFFLNKMRKTILPYCDFLSYCLMPNHFHWLVRAKEEVEILRLREEIHRMTQSHPMNRSNLNHEIGVLLRSYTRALQKQKEFTGSLFQQKTKAKEVLSFDNSIVTAPHNSINDDLFTCFNYVHQNPWKAGLVKRLEEWEFSSFRDYAGFRNGTLCNQKMGFDLLRIKTRKEFLKVSYEVIDMELLNRIF